MRNLEYVSPHGRPDVCVQLNLSLTQAMVLVVVVWLVIGVLSGGVAV
ncbi:hypothetical protein FHR84_000466 [Actinopolyspora biskrensis]|uniref:Uncharacterized protein n=1 Tax=Actinopolyspora biskrensis TaxID=1470178 RepID=A0A852YTU6_9ACTN|nr:hypothetical protein [Actinopolyspora biskrensis]